MLIRIDIQGSHHRGWPMKKRDSEKLDEQTAEMSFLEFEDAG